MTRTKWMRLVVRDLGDILRWARQQDARRLDEFRHRIIGGREIVSFRMVPRYPIEIGTNDIVVVAYARGGLAHRLGVAAQAAGRRSAGMIRALTGRLTAAPQPIPHIAELREFPATRLPSRR